MGVENIKVEPMYVYMGTTQVQIQKISCVADVSGSLNNKYFLFYDAAGTKRYAWFNVSAGGSDPALSGYTGHAVAISTNDSATAVATALAAVLTAVSGFDATSSGYQVTLTATATGYAVPAHDAQASASRTAFGFEVTQVGDTYESIGLLDGEIEISGLSRAPADITAHQSGPTIIGQILTGSGNPELSFSLSELTSANYEKILRYSSGSYLPVGSGTTKLMGGGSLGQFKVPPYAKVVLHPVRLDTADKSNDYCFWKTSIDLDSVSFSGEAPVVLPVSVRAFKDTSKPAAIDTWVYGDWSQSLT